MKKKLLALAIVSLTAMMFISSANATAILDTTSGGDYFFEWSGFGQIDEIYTTSGPGGTIDRTTDYGIDWSITVAQDSYLDMATAWDDYVPGDVFGLVVDGSSTAWTTTSTDSSGYFHGIYEDLFLSAGTHTITLDVLSGLTYGGAWASFTGTTAIDPVPEPSTIMLMGIGLLGLVGFSRKRLMK